MEPESGLAIGNTRSGNCTKLGDCGDDGGDRNENDLNDGRNVVDNGELKGPKSGLRVCEGESKDRG